MADGLFNSEDIICDLLKNNIFPLLSTEEKVRIKNMRPTPNLLMKQKDGKCIRRFQTKWYTTQPWLTGSIKKNKLFCFPCLLFGGDKSSTEWTKTGLGEESLKNLSIKVKRHVASLNHITSNICLRELGGSVVAHAVCEAARLVAVKHNERVKRNRELFERLIQTVCFLGRPDAVFPHQDEADSEDYQEMLDFLALKETCIKELMESETNLKIPEYQHEIIECVIETLQDKIREEIAKSNFISVQVDETNDVSITTQISVTFRYVNVDNGKIEERFVGFYDVSGSVSSPDILPKKILDVLRLWKISPDKLIAQTYDGAILMALQNGSANVLKKEYPLALFIHCYAHQLNLVLLHGAKHIKLIKLFLADTTLFFNFFSRSINRMQLLRDRGFNLPQPYDTEWNFHSNSIQTIRKYFSDLKAALIYITDDPNKEWDLASFGLAKGVLKVLIDSKFVYLLNFFCRIFIYTDTLMTCLQNDTLDIFHRNDQLKNCIDKVSKLKNEQTILDCIGESRQMLCPDNCDEEDFFGEIYGERTIEYLKKVSFKILDCVTTQLETRFSYFSELIFVELLNPKKFQVYRETKGMPEDAYRKLTHAYPFFDCDKLKSELAYIYSTEDKHLSPQNLLKYLINNNLADCLPEIVKLIQLLLTIPVLSTNGDRGSTSCLKRIKSYLRSSMENSKLSNYPSLFIENELAKSLSRDLLFTSKVIDSFAVKTETQAELVYKKI